MSETIDQRVVEMRFDNRHFEENVRTSMSTLDKLKEKLHLKGASKGLDELNTAAKKIDMSNLGNSVTQVGLKFNGLYSMADQALRNLENRIEQAARRMVSAFTIDPVKTGFQEYETQINAIQTILANTQSKGTTLDDVNNALDTLNKYADQTIYNFTEMTRNIGTFTAAGVDLQTSVDSIKGIANLAAVSGSTSQQASTAMYQLSQALAAGRVSLMDWNSVVNAGMGGEVFQTALIRTSELLKTGAKDAIDTYGSFRESLTRGEWLTTEVLTETLKQLSGAYTKADLIAQGFTESQAEEIAKLAETAVGAATDVKTFTQLWDTLKESAQSGWTQTWEIIIGDFGEAKKMLSKVSEVLGDSINKMSDSRNKLLEGALGGKSKWDNLIEKINAAGVSTDKFQEKLKETAKKHNISLDDLIKKHGSLAKVLTSGELSTSIIVETFKKFIGVEKEAAETTEKVTDKLEYFQDMVTRVVRGEFGNGDDRVKALTEAGHDYAQIQELVNLCWRDGKLDLSKLTAEQLENMGYTKAQAESLKELANEAEKTGVPIEELIASLEKPTGRELLIDSLSNAWKGLVTVLSSVKKAFTEIFPPMTSEQLYNIIAKINDLSKKLVVSDETADKLRRTFKGLFAIIDIITTIAGGAFKTVLSIVNSILGHFNLNVLDVTAAIGDAIVKVRDWIDEHNIFAKGIEIILPYLKKAAEGIKEWIDSLKESDNIPRDIILGLINGLKSGTGMVLNVIIDIGKGILESIKSVLGIHSPSTEFFDIGKNVIEGLINGIIEGAPKVIEWIKKIGSWLINGIKETLSKTGETTSKGISEVIDFIKGISFRDIIAAGLLAGITVFAKKIFDIFDILSEPLQGLNDMLAGLGQMFRDIGKWFSAAAFKKKTQGILNIAKAIGILAISLFLIASIDPNRLWPALGVLSIIIVLIGALAFAMSKMDDIETEGFGKLAIALVGFSAALLILGFAMKKIGGLDEDQVKQAGIVIAAFSGLMIILMYVSKYCNNARRLDGLGKMFLKISASLLIMAVVMKILGSMKQDQIEQGLIFITALSILIAGLIFVTKFAGKDVDKIGKTISKIGMALLLMAVTMKILGSMKPDELDQGIIFITGLSILIMGLIWVTKFAGKDIDKVGGTIFKISLALLVLAGVTKILGNMQPNQLFKGIVATALLSVIIRGLISATKLAGKNANKMALTILAISIAIGILAAVSVVLSLIDMGGLFKGIIAVGLLGTIMALMIKSTKGAKKCVGNIVALSVAIAIMATSLVVLSLINTTKLFGATTALATVMGVFALILKNASNISSSIGPLIVMAVAIGILATALYLLSKLPTESVLGTAVSLSVLMLTMSIVMKSLGSMGSPSIKAMASLVVITLVIGALAYILYKIQDLPVESTISNALAISTLLISMSLALGILTLIGLGGPAAFVGLAALGTLIVGLGALIAGIGALVTEFPQLETFINTGIPILEKIGYALGSFFGNIIAGFTANATNGLADMADDLSLFMLKLQPFIIGAKMIDESSLTGVKSLVEMIAMISGANILEHIASWVTGESSMSVFSTQITDFGNAIVSFSKIISGNIDEGAVTAAANAGLLLAEMTDTIPKVGGIAQAFTGTADLSLFSSQLTAFGSAIVDFSNTITENGGIDVDAVTAATNAGKLMTAMQDTIAPTGGVVQWFAGEKDLTGFGLQLMVFGDAIVGFSNTISQNGGINEEAVQAAANAGEIMATMQSKIVPSGGVLQWFTGEKNMNTFGLQLMVFGDAIVDFSKTVSGNIDEEAVQAAANAGEMMATMQSKIVPSFGVVQWFTGDQDMNTFSSGIVTFGEAIVAFSRAITENGGIEEDAMVAAANAGELLAKIQSKLTPIGGVVSFFTGEKNLSDFGGQIKAFGEAIVAFSETVSGNIDEEAVQAAANAGGIMAELQDAIPKDEWFDGKVSLDDFGKDLKKFGGYMADYSDKVSEVDQGAVSKSITSAEDLVALTNSLSGVDSSNIDNFKIKPIGEAISSYSDDVEYINTENITSSISSAKKLVSLIRSMAGLDSSGVNSFQTALTALGKINTDTFVNNFSKTSSKLSSVGSDMIDSVVNGMRNKQVSLNNTVNSIINKIIQTIKNKSSNFKTVGQDLMSKLISGIISQKSKIETSIDKSISSAVSSAREYYDNFYNAGSYLVSGFANGISANSYKAEAKAKAMATAAKEAAEEALGIQSPSKVFYKIGDYTGQGFINALSDYSSKSYKAGSNMADYARKGLTNAIGRIADIVNSDIDTQPTIRPVLDLSDVESGANTINGMFGFGSSVGVLANVGTISSMMNGYNQNGGNGDVVSAINKLRKDLGNVGGDSYNVNGITYDDGSNVASAIKSIVRAAKIERRI